MSQVCAAVSILYAVAVVALIALSYQKQKLHLRPYFKMVASGLYLVLAVLFGVFRHPAMLAGFVLCFFGDTALSITGKNGSKKYFTTGLGLFLAGHIAFVFGIYPHYTFLPVQILISGICIVFCLGIFKLPKMKPERYRVPILVYTFFVSGLFAKGLVSYLYFDGTKFTLVGTALFLISDFILLFLYFYKSKQQLTRGLNLICYYAAQYLLILGMKR